MSTPSRLVIVEAGIGEPSTSRMLAEQIVRSVAKLGDAGEFTTRTITLRDLLPEVPAALTSQLLGPQFTEAVAAIADADGIIASTPVYKAGASGLFTTFFQVLDNDLLIGRPVILAATAGTPRHALVVDDQMRSLFAYLRALPTPTSVFAATEDWGSPELQTRIERASLELLHLVRSGFAAKVREESWSKYQHEFGSDGGRETSIDYDSAMMRLAAGGTLRPPDDGEAMDSDH